MRLVFVLLLLALSACGGDETSETAERGSPPASAMGPGLSVAEAIGSGLEGPLLVRGVLVERDGKLRLCSAILESHPPQCGEPSLAIEGEVQGKVGDQVKLLGEVESGALRLTPTATG
jgi:hypothetical protein